LGGPEGVHPLGVTSTRKPSKEHEAIERIQINSNQRKKTKTFQKFFNNFLSLNSKEKVSSTNHHRHPLAPRGRGRYRWVAGGGPWSAVVDESQRSATQVSGVATLGST